jgi:hypothetical protein
VHAVPARLGHGLITRALIIHHRSRA